MLSKIIKLVTGKSTEVVTKQTWWNWNISYAAQEWPQLQNQDQFIWHLRLKQRNLQEQADNKYQE